MFQHGYAVMNNRVCVKNTKSLFLTLRHGFSITACIPQSVHLPGGEWAEDFISHADYRKYGMVKLPVSHIPYLQNTTMKYTDLSLCVCVLCMCISVCFCTITKQLAIWQQEI